MILMSHRSAVKAIILKLLRLFIPQVEGNERNKANSLMSDRTFTMHSHNISYDLPNKILIRAKQL